MAGNYGFLLLMILVVMPSSEAKWGRGTGSLGRLDSVIRSGDDDQDSGTRWAVLVAGSEGYANYRHQADVCHAYQVLKKGGLKDENIVVFMYDDIAMSDLNPRKGVIINTPQGENVYPGVPKDYTGDQVTPENLYAVILGNKTSVTGGSGKVVNSGPNDRIFIYYSDHGGAGTLGMPNEKYVYAKDLNDVLKKKHDAGTYKEMVIYVEACEAGSIFDGLMPDDLNIYVQTASAPTEYSWSTYCPDMNPPPPPEYLTCLGDVYSISWMEDSEAHNLKEETIDQQYTAVKERTARVNKYNNGSHVMEYGTMDIKQDDVYLFQGFDSDSKYFPQSEGETMAGIDQREADILFLWKLYNSTAEGSEKRKEIFKQISQTMAQRAHLDNSIIMIGKHLFGSEKSSSILTFTRNPGLPVVDDWDCLKSTVQLFVTHCGPLTQYGLKHVRAFANLCNNRIDSSAMEDACRTVCSKKSVASISVLSVGGYNV